MAAANHEPAPNRRARQRLLRWVVVVMVASVGAALLAREVLQGRLQARFFAWVARDVHHHVGHGPNPDIIFPDHGPYDARLGYAQLPDFIDRLTARGAVVEAQARWSPRMTQLTRLGLFAAYDEKPTAGLRLLDRGGRLLYDAAARTPTYRDLSEVPRLVAATLIFLENRELLDERVPHRNPAIEWTRLAFAATQAGVRVFEPDHKVPGASTLATQMEKFRHSPGGRTPDAREKLRQMLSAAVRAYLDGADTREARHAILTDYLNGMPLGAAPGHGEVHGLAEGLAAWFGADFAEVNRRLVDADHRSPGAPVPEATARAYKQVLALLVGLRRPTYFLRQRPDALEAACRVHLAALAEQGVITPALRDAARAAPLVLGGALAAGAPEVADRKGADAVRLQLLDALGLARTYDLDRLDLTVTTTLDLPAQAAVSDTLRALRTPEGAAEAGIVGTRLIGKTHDPAGVHYSFTLYERVAGRNVVRVHTDTQPGQFSLNDGMKLELGSTAKLRTLVSWLELLSEAYMRLAPLDRAALARVEVDPADRLTAWMIQYLRRHRTHTLRDALEAAMDRRFSASPHERFYTGGGVHRFGNFDDDSNGRTYTVRKALQQSVNLSFVRIMKEVVDHLAYGDGHARAVLDDPAHPERQALLEGFADLESATFLDRFRARYEGLSADHALAKLGDHVAPEPRRVAVVFRSVRPEAPRADFDLFVRARVERTHDDDDLAALWDEANPARWSLKDRAYLARVHPLELWLLAYRQVHGDADRETLMAASADARREAYDWLIETDRPRAQNNRLRVMFERRAFDRLHQRWVAVGFPFDHLVPSLGTALGSSGDRPSALAELMGILSAGGMRYPTERVTRLHFASGTPYETVLAPGQAEGRRVLPAEVADVARAALRDVVTDGTAHRVHSAFGGGALELGGKTGTGDNRVRRVDAQGRVLEETVHSRTGTLVFYVGDRWFGAVTAYVGGEAADAYDFTSALPAQVLKTLAPRILTAFGPARPAPAPGPSTAPVL